MLSIQSIFFSNVLPKKNSSPLNILAVKPGYSQGVRIHLLSGSFKRIISHNFQMVSQWIRFAMWSGHSRRIFVNFMRSLSDSRIRWRSPGMKSQEQSLTGQDTRDQFPCRRASFSHAVLIQLTLSSLKSSPRGLIDCKNVSRFLASTLLSWSSVLGSPAVSSVCLLEIAATPSPVKEQSLSCFAFKSSFLCCKFSYLENLVAAKIFPF